MAGPLPTDATRALLLPDLAVVEDLAVLVKATPGTIRRWLREGRLPGRRIGRRWIVERRALLDALRPDVGRPLRLLDTEDRT